jgi:hypothetical protein
MNAAVRVAILATLGFAIAANSMPNGHWPSEPALSATQPEATAAANCTTGIDEDGNVVQPPLDCQVQGVPTAAASVTYWPISPFRVWDCADFVFVEDAQAMLVADPLVAPLLDLDGNGIACDPPAPVDPEAMDRLIDSMEPQGDVAALQSEAEAIVALAVGESPMSADMARQQGVESAASVWEMIAADDADRFCNAIGYSVPEGWDTPNGIRPTPQMQARYWTCHPIADANEVQCSQPFYYAHPVDPTLSVPDGNWVMICRVYPLGGDRLGVVVDPRDFSIVDATGQRFGYQPLPVWAGNITGEPLYREHLLPGEVTGGTLTFMGSWAELDPASDYPLRLNGHLGKLLS